MKILVCMKQVPQKDAPLKLNESGAWIREDVSYEVNEPDAYALEEALRQKEKHSGEVVVITAGPARAQQVLREGLAKGADRAIHLEDSAFSAMDAFNISKAFVAAIKDEQFDLIFTGLQSDDHGYAQTGVIMAELLGWPHATIIMEIQKSDGGIKVKRELESGFFQHVTMPLPAVLTIQSGINKLRYSTLIVIGIIMLIAGLGWGLFVGWDARAGNIFMRVIFGLDVFIALILIAVGFGKKRHVRK